MTKEQKLKNVGTLVSKPEWNYLSDYIDELVAVQHNVLTTAPNFEVVREAQGMLKAYRQIKNLPDVVRSLNKK